MTVSLHRLRERFPALCVGAAARDVELAELARRLAGELRRLRTVTVAFRSEGICPQDFLSLFSPERRFAVLNGGAEYRDWRRAAAVRLARVVLGRVSGAPLAVLDAELANWRSNPLISGGVGMLAFVRGVLSGEAAEGIEESLEEPPVWNGMTIRGFVAAGSTSLVYRVDGGNVLKVPRPGGEARFRREVELLRRLDHPHLPRLRGGSLDGEPYCVMDFCRTGRAVRENANCEAALLSALEYVHGFDLLHGDIRWSNLGIGPSGATVLLDFSHARAPSSPGESAAETEKMKRLLA